MTQHLIVQADSPVKINETELAVLCSLYTDSGSSIISLGQIAERVNRSVPSIRRTLRLLEKKGLLKSTTRHLGNGAQLESEYELTTRGRSVVDNAPVSMLTSLLGVENRDDEK